MGATRSKAQKAGWAKSWGPWAGLLGLLGLWAYFHFQVLFLGHNFVYLDAGNFFYPLWEWGARVWRSGFLPLWDPDAAFGFPAVADPENLTWYPPKIVLYLLFPAGTAFKLLGLGHSLWLLLGFWLFARDRGAAGWPAAFGTVAFGFGFESVALLTGASAL
ncbi:MAG TPA: hypothetical protein VFR02_06520, partial [bacterium]|nr:hypothetical protein [bacterium]